MRRGGQEIDLTKTELRLLVELGLQPRDERSAERCCSRGSGATDYFGDSRLVDVHIRRLRTKIEADRRQSLATS